MNWPEILKQLAKEYSWLPAQILDMPIGQFWAIRVGGNARRPSSPERLREIRNQQRIKAGKPPLQG